MKNNKPKTQAERHQVKITGLTFSDINECFYLAIMDSSGEDDMSKKAMDKWLKTKKIDANFVYELKWEYIDPIAIRQNLNCRIEKKMGIFPNIETLKYTK